jgi:hypothetical protein
MRHRNGLFSHFLINSLFVTVYETFILIKSIGPPGRVERSRPVFRSALYSPFAPAFRSRECHNNRPCTVQSLPLTEACLRNYRTSLFIQAFTKSG